MYNIIQYYIALFAVYHTAFIVNIIFSSKISAYNKYNIEAP